MVLTGDVTRSFSGVTAQFGDGTAPGTDEPTWLVTLEGGPSGVDGGAFLSTGGQPGNGTFDIVWFDVPGDIPGDSFGTLAVVNPDGAAAGFVGAGRSGTITITSSSTTSVTGTFEFEAEGLVLLPGGGTEAGVVLVGGEFDALPAPEPATLVTRLEGMQVGGPPR
jgi:hypothetical protein